MSFEEDRAKALELLQNWRESGFAPGHLDKLPELMESMHEKSMERIRETFSNPAEEE